MQGPTETASRQSALAGILTTAAVALTLSAAPAAVATTQHLIPVSDQNADIPTTEDFSEDSWGGLSVGEGMGTLPTDEDYEVMLHPEEHDIPDEVEVWAFPEDGEDTVLIGSGETTSDQYTNPGAIDAEPQDVELLEVNLPSSEVNASQWYAFAVFNASTGDLVTWTAYPVTIEEDPRDFSGQPTDVWPVPDPGSRQSPSTDPPTRDLLSDETHGLVSVLQDSTMLPLDEPITVEVISSTVTVDLWLMFPEDEEAVFLPAERSTEETIQEYPQWEIQINSEDVNYNGIYGLAAVDENDGFIGWAAFGISTDGEDLRSDDPGVHPSDPDYSDRSVWPIPDSVPGPEEEEESPTAEPTETEDTEEPTPSETDTTPATDEPTTAPTADAENTSGIPAAVWVGIGAAALIGIVLVLWFSSRGRSKSQSAQQPLQ